MALAAMTIERFLAEVGAKTPAPGGGAVAAMTGATAAALARMVVAYSIGKKSLAEHDGMLRRADAALARVVDMFVELGDEDAAAYALVNELSRLPETDARRVREYPGAVEAAVQVPQAALALAADLLRLMDALPGATNRHLASDLAIAAMLGESAARSAWWNVRVNLALLPDTARAEQIRAECGRMLAQADAIRRRVEAACEDNTAPPSAPAAPSPRAGA